MKKIVKIMISLTLLVAYSIPILAENESHENMTEVNLESKATYRLEGTTVVEYLLKHYDEGFVEITRYIYSDGIMTGEYKLNGNIFYEITADNIDYEYYVGRALKDNTTLLPRNCNVNDSLFTHYFQDSWSDDLDQGVITTIIGIGIIALLSRLAQKFTNLPADWHADTADTVFTLLCNFVPSRAKIITNQYLLRYNSTGGLYKACFHTNSIIYNSLGNIVTGAGGMTYLQL